MIDINKSINFLKKNLSKVVIAITVLLFIFIAYFGAKLTWLMLEPKPTFSSWKAPAANQKNNGNVAVDFSNFYWFGKPNAQQVVPRQEEITDAPKTTLNMTLTGVVANNDINHSMAIIEYQSNQETYFINQKIKSTRAVVAKIHSDRVILKNNGKYETLMLDGFDYSKNSQIKASPKPKPKKSTKKTFTNQRKKQLVQTRKEILNDPGKIIDYIAITPVNSNGKIKGYRLNAGKKPELFRESGLKPRDLAIAINGYDLTDTLQSLTVMSELKDMKNIMITVERDGQLTDIEFALP